MIRFCDKIIYNMVEGEMSRNEIFTFFISDEQRMFDVVAVYSEQEEFLGIITYNNVLKGTTVASCMNSARVCVTENFWQEASAYFESNPDELLTIIDETGGILGFAYNDKCKYLDVNGCLNSMEKNGMPPALGFPKYRNIRMLVITDLNELAWRVRKIFLENGYQVCVLGEKWEWFGCKSGEGYLECAEFEKLYLYAEGTDFLREPKRLMTVNYNNVEDSFKGIVELFSESMRKIYVKGMNRLLHAGATVCEIIIPDEVSYKTELERCAEGCSNEINFAQHALFNKAGVMSEKEKQWIEKVYGAEVVREARELDVTALLQREREVYVGNLIGRTLNNGSLGRKRIYVIGPCIVYGYGCSAEGSLVGMLQQVVEKEGYQVVGFALNHEDYPDWQMLLDNITIRSQDIILVVGGVCRNVQ